MTESKADIFEKMYSASRPPWDIRCVQPAIGQLIGDGTIVGPVLDVGCGTGATVKALSDAGFLATGLDFCKKAIENADQLDLDRSLASFVWGDIMATDRWRHHFATVIDCGTINTISTAQTPQYVAALRTVLRPAGRLVVMCFSDLSPVEVGRRFSKSDLESLFSPPEWMVKAISRVTFQAYDHNLHAVVQGPHAFIVTAVASRNVRNGNTDG